MGLETNNKENEEPGDHTKEKKETDMKRDTSYGQRKDRVGEASETSISGVMLKVTDLVGGEDKKVSNMVGRAENLEAATVQHFSTVNQETQSSGNCTNRLNRRKFLFVIAIVSGFLLIVIIVVIVLFTSKAI